MQSQQPSTTLTEISYMCIAQNYKRKTCAAHAHIVFVPYVCYTYIRIRATSQELGTNILRSYIHFCKGKHYYNIYTEVPFFLCASSSNVSISYIFASIDASV